MQLFSWNVNGIRAVIKKGALQECISKHSPDILCLQETKALQEESKIDLPEYTEYWNSAEKKGYSGTAIFTKTPPIQVTNDIPAEHLTGGALQDQYGDANREGRVIAAEFDTFFVVTVYTPNSKDDLSRLIFRHTMWDPAFLRYMSALQTEKPVLCCGDINVAHTEDDLANPKPNIGKHGFTDEERDGFQRIVDAGFLDTFRLYTKGNGHYSWWTHWANARARNVGWRIDYWLASSSLRPRITDARIHADIMGSDHCPVSVTVEM